MKTVIVFFYALIGIYGILIFDASWIICYLLFSCVRCSMTFIFSPCPGSVLLLVVTLAEYLRSCLRVCVVVVWSELRLGRWHCTVSGRDPSVGVLSYYCFEYYIWFNCKFIIDLVIELSFSVYIEFLYRVHHHSFSSYMYYIHNFINWVYWVLVFEKMLCKFRLRATMFVVSVVFLVSALKIFRFVLHISYCMMDTHHKHQGLAPLIRSVSRVTTALANVSSVLKLFFFLVVCSDMISKGFGLVALELKVGNNLKNLSCVVLSPTVVRILAKFTKCHIKHGTT